MSDTVLNKIEEQTFKYPLDDVKIKDGKLTLPNEVYYNIIDAISVYSNMNALTVFGSYNITELHNEKNTMVLGFCHQFIGTDEITYNVFFDLKVTFNKDDVQIHYDGVYTKHKGLSLDLAFK